jgi:molybdopterin converting factor small subunit
MSMPVLLFASYADVFGARRVQCPVAVPCTVQILVDALRLLPGGDRLPPQPLVAVNQRFVDGTATIQPGDEVALIPPVAGG